MDISPTHYKRVLENPEQYAERLAVIYHKAVKFIEKNDRALDPPFQDEKVEIDTSDKRLNRVEIVADYSVDQVKILKKQNAVLVKYLKLVLSKEQIEKLEAELEQITPSN